MEEPPYKHLRQAYSHSPQVPFKIRSICRETHSPTECLCWEQICNDERQQQIKMFWDKFSPSTKSNCTHMLTTFFKFFPRQILWLSKEEYNEDFPNQTKVLSIFKQWKNIGWTNWSNIVDVVRNIIWTWVQGTQPQVFSKWNNSGYTPISLRRSLELASYY